MKASPRVRAATKGTSAISGKAGKSGKSKAKIRDITAVERVKTNTSNKPSKTVKAGKLVGRAAPPVVPDATVTALIAASAKVAATTATTGERVKLVRDSFTMPREDFELIATLKSRALEFRRPTKKSELLRAGLQQLAALSEAQLRDALAVLRPLQAGRPRKKR